MDSQFVWQFIVWLVGCSIPTGIVVYCVRQVTARFTTALDSYSGERAKVLAQFHNLDRLLELTDKLTATTETIKIRLSDEQWDRQQRWKTRLEFYQSLFRVLADLKENVNSLMWEESLGSASSSDKRLRGFPQPSEEVQQLNAAMAKSHAELRALLTFGEIVVGEPGRRCLNRINESLNDQDDLESYAMFRFDTRLEKMLPIAVSEAKADLGFPDKQEAAGP